MKRCLKKQQDSNRFVDVCLSTIVLLAILALPEMALAEADGCDVGGGANDIESLMAAYDIDNGEITVVMTLCAEPDNKTKYRVHFDHMEPYFDVSGTEDDRNGDGEIDENDFCATTSDDGMKHHRGEDTGPGSIVVDGMTITYTVGLMELNPVLTESDTVYVWADTQFKGINDRAPNTESGDGCTKPEVESEVLVVSLAPEGFCPGNDDRYEDQNDGTVLDCNTGLVWLKDASCLGSDTWDNINGTSIFTKIDALNSGTEFSCTEYTAGTHVDWRLPEISELCSAWAGSQLFPCPAAAAQTSLIDSSLVSFPKVTNTAGVGGWTNGDAFVGVSPTVFWSATPFGQIGGWNVNLINGNVHPQTGNGAPQRIWPVRDGQ